LMTDNGNGYRSYAHAAVCRKLGIRHLFTQPYRPKTNGKACVLGWWGRPAGRRGSPRLSV
jgi:transposase InsO family protein